MKSGDIVVRSDVIGYKGIILKECGPAPASDQVVGQLWIFDEYRVWRIFWFLRPYETAPQVEDLPQKYLHKVGGTDYET